MNEIFFEEDFLTCLFDIDEIQEGCNYDGLSQQAIDSISPGWHIKSYIPKGPAGTVIKHYLGPIPVIDINIIVIIPSVHIWDSIHLSPLKMINYSHFWSMNNDQLHWPDMELLIYGHKKQWVTIESQRTCKMNFNFSCLVKVPQHILPHQLMELENRIFEVVLYFFSFLFSAVCHLGGNNFFDNIDRDFVRQKRSGFCQSLVYKKMNDELYEFALHDSFRKLYSSRSVCRNYSLAFHMHKCMEVQIAVRHNICLQVKQFTAGSHVDSEPLKYAPTSVNLYSCLQILK